MNYTLMAYLIAILLVASFAVMPQFSIITIKEISYEMAHVIDYWMVVNGLIYASRQGDPESAFEEFLAEEMDMLDERVMDVPSYEVLDISVSNSALSTRVRFRHEWGLYDVEVFLWALVKREERGVLPRGIPDHQG